MSAIHILTTGARRNPLGRAAHLDMPIVIGFGSAVVTRDGRTVLDGERAKPGRHADWMGYMRVRHAEKVARRHPRSTWRIEINGPLWSAVWERKRPGKWLCVEAGEGFA